MDEFIDKIADLMNTYPPLWMVYGFVLVLPFVLMACCFIKPKSKDDAARRKKTDEPTPDTKPSGKKESQKADAASLVRSQMPEKLTAPTSSASRPKSSGPQEGGDVRQRSGGKSSIQSGREDTAKHTILITEAPAGEDLPEEDVEYTLKEEVVGSVVVVSKAKHSQVSVLDVEENASKEQTENADEKQTENADEKQTENAEEKQTENADEKQTENADEKQTENADEKQTESGTELPQSKVEEEGKPTAAAETGETPSSSKEEIPGSVQLTMAEEETVSEEHHFPPVLEDFDLMECEADPSDVEEYLVDPRLKEIFLTLSGEEQLGLIIVGGADSPNGSLPVYIKKVVPGGVASKDDRISEGDQLLAVNDKILLECNNSYAVDVLRKAKGKTRLLVIQDY